MTFKLKVGDVIILKDRINSPISGCGWSSGYYRVTSIGPGYGTARCDRGDPRVQTYFFQRIKKDGTNFGKSQGYNAQVFDSTFIDLDKVELVK